MIAGFQHLNHVEVTFNGTTATDLHNYIETTAFDVLPAPNLISPDATPTMTKGYFMVLAPLSRGTHTLHAFDEFTFGFEAGITSRSSCDRQPLSWRSFWTFWRPSELMNVRRMFWLLDDGYVARIRATLPVFARLVLQRPFS